jgi:hypothetical protein
VATGLLVVVVATVLDVDVDVDVDDGAVPTTVVEARGCWAL